MKKNVLDQSSTNFMASAEDFGKVSYFPTYISEKIINNLVFGNLIYLTGSISYLSKIS